MVPFTNSRQYYINSRHEFLNLFHNGNRTYPDRNGIIRICIGDMRYYYNAKEAYENSLKDELTEPLGCLSVYKKKANSKELRSLGYTGSTSLSAELLVEILAVYKGFKKKVCVLIKLETNEELPIYTLDNLPKALNKYRMVQLLNGEIEEYKGYVLKRDC